MSIMRKGRLVSFDNFNEQCSSASSAGLQNKFKVVEVSGSSVVGDTIKIQHYDYPNLVVGVHPKNVTFCNTKPPSLAELNALYADGVPSIILERYGYQSEPA